MVSLFQLPAVFSIFIGRITMKKLVVSGFLSLILLFLFSCDKVKNPIVKKETAVGSKFITNSNKQVANYKKVLLEDYTGQRCPNCPRAASTIENVLLPQYSNTLIVISVHQGDLATPIASYPNDFRTAAGDVWGSSAGFGKFSTWPIGLINRKNYGGSGLVLQDTKWTSVVPLALADPLILKLDVRTEYDTTVRALNTYVKGTYLQAYSNPVKIIVVYLQDGIIGKQDNNGVEVDDYEFHDMLRGDISGTWGVDFKIGAVTKNTVDSLSFLNFSLPTADKKGVVIEDKNVSVVVFAYDASTREVLQAEKLLIKKQEQAK
jgi:hypothetical protein